MRSELRRRRFPTEQYAKVDGATANGVNYLMDGVDYNDTYINANIPFPNPDAIEEFNLLTGNMSANYGDAIGGVVNVVTKSGTNQIHGDAFEFVRNNIFDAADYFSPTVNPLHQNQFGPARAVQSGKTICSSSAAIRALVSPPPKTDRSLSYRTLRSEPATFPICCRAPN